MLELLIQTDDAWRVDGRCNDGSGALTHLFFSDDIHDIARAKAICCAGDRSLPRNSRTW